MLLTTGVESIAGDKAGDDEADVEDVAELGVDTFSAAICAS